MLNSVPGFVWMLKNVDYLLLQNIDLYFSNVPHTAEAYIAPVTEQVGDLALNSQDRTDGYQRGSAQMWKGGDICPRCEKQVFIAEKRQAAGNVSWLAYGLYRIICLHIYTHEPMERGGVDKNCDSTFAHGAKIITNLLLPSLSSVLSWEMLHMFDLQQETWLDQANRERWRNIMQRFVEYLFCNSNTDDKRITLTTVKETPWEFENVALFALGDDTNDLIDH